MLLIPLRSSKAMKRGQHYDIIWTLRTSEQPDAIDYIMLVNSDEAGQHYDIIWICSMLIESDKAGSAFWYFLHTTAL